MKKKLLIILIIVLLPTVAYSDKTTAPKTPKEIIEAVKSKGPKQAIAELFKSGTWEKSVYPGIASGNKEWLDVAVVLQPAADAGASEEMSDALSLALLKRPDLALPILKKIWWKDSEACYFGWDSEFPKEMPVRSYVNRLEKTVKQSSSKETAELRKSCLRGIEQTRKALEENKQ